MIRVVSIALFGILAAAGSSADAATLETHALVRIVPPVEVAWTADQSAWQVQTEPAATWQARLETRDLDGRLLDVRPLSAMPRDAAGGVQDLATVAATATPETGDPVHVRLVLCRE
ncbi:hypothetical protein GF314_17185 [bacterium]|nr:hypothetical protein [bacterium]